LVHRYIEEDKKTKKKLTKSLIERRSKFESLSKTCGHDELVKKLDCCVCELSVPGLQNFPQIFLSMRDSLKIKSVEEHPHDVKGKIEKIDEIIKVWPYIILCGDVFSYLDGQRLNKYLVSKNPDYGFLYEPMINFLCQEYKIDRNIFDKNMFKSTINTSEPLEPESSLRNMLLNIFRTNSLSNILDILKNKYSSIIVQDFSEKDKALLFFGELLYDIQDNFYAVRNDSKFVKDKVNTDLMNSILKELKWESSLLDKFKPLKSSHQKWRRWRNLYENNDIKWIISSQKDTTKKEILMNLNEFVENSGIIGPTSTSNEKIEVTSASDTIDQNSNPQQSNKSKKEISGQDQQIPKSRADTSQNWRKP